MENQCFASCSRQMGAKGRNASQILIFLFTCSAISRLRGLARIERCPSALGPHSKRALHKSNDPICAQIFAHLFEPIIAEFFIGYFTIIKKRFYL